MAVGLIGIHGALAIKVVELVSKNVIGLAHIRFLSTVENLVKGHLVNLKYATRAFAQVRNTFNCYWDFSG